MNNKIFFGRSDGKSNLFFNKNKEKTITRNSNIYHLNRKSDFHLSEDENDVYAEESSYKGHKIFNKNNPSDYVLDNRNINKNLNLKKSDSKLNVTNNKTYYKTAEEKFKLLEDLDRLTSPQNNNLGLDRPIVSGICQDMCPEKERYLREYQDSISIFERDEKNQFDHKRAVKEYQRCTIDQEESQPHNLRPTEVLQRTMDYLLTEIVDNVDKEKFSWRQWYGFLWDKTRSIRKDITQQNLCNETVIGVVESITRFHIFCAAWLCEDTSDNFDPRLNDEHLKNCLQTLKNMYADMPADSCANEPEFRSYMIILNLDKGEILDEAQKLTSRVFHSPKLAFAISVFQAVSTNNYVRFFRLLEKADLILSCLLHRFIVPMRLRSLEVMNRAYVTTKSTEKGTNQIPLTTMVRQLKFESIDEVLEFCNATNQKWIHFMNVPMIVLNYSNLVIPKDQDLIKKSIMLVESKQGKRKLSTIFGGDRYLSDFGSNLPECKMVSFDENGCYIGSKQIPMKIINTTKKAVQSDRGDESEIICLDTGSEEEQEEEEKQPKISDDTYFESESHHESEFEVEGTKKVINQQTTLFSNVFKFSNPTVINGINRCPTGSSNETAILTNTISNSTSLFSGNPISNSTGISLFSIVTSQSLSNTPGLFPNLTIPLKTECGNKNIVFKQQTENKLSESFTDLSQSINQSEFTFKNVNHQSNYNFPSAVESKKDDIFVSKEELQMIYNDNIEKIISEVVQSRCEVECDLIVEREKILNEEVNKTKDSIIKCLFQEVLMEVVVDHNQNREIVADIICEDLINEMIRKLTIERAAAIWNEQNYLIDLLRHNQLKYYFRNWIRFTKKSIKDRKCLTKLSAAPRVLDDFSACENFRGKVRKISTDWFTSKDISWSKNSMLYRLEQITGVEKLVMVKPSERCASAQTNMSFHNRRFIALKIFVKDFLKKRFFNVLDTKLNVLKFWSLIDPSPEILISDYNNLVDELVEIVMKTKSIDISFIDFSKLKLIPIKPIKSFDENNWQIVMNDIFDKWGLGFSQKAYFIKIVMETFHLIDENVSQYFSCFHFRLFPWIHIVKRAVENKLSIFDSMSGSNFQIWIEIDRFSGHQKLQIESIDKEMSVKECIQKCKKSASHIPNVQQQLMSNLKSKRSELFSDICNKIDDLEKRINDCTEH